MIFVNFPDLSDGLTLSSYYSESLRLILNSKENRQKRSKWRCPKEVEKIKKRVEALEKELIKKCGEEAPPSKTA